MSRRRSGINNGQHYKSFMNRGTTRLDVFATPQFIATLLLLLLNDHVLKYSFPGWLTGKLSDFAGVFVFVSFFYACFPKRNALINYSTAFIFILWKSPYSQLLIDYWNSLNILVVERVVDYTDLLALTILPVAKIHFTNLGGYHSKRILAIPIAYLSLFAILGTSVPRTFLARQIQFSTSRPPPLEMIQSGITEVASRFKLTCSRCEQNQPYRSYTGQSFWLETSFDSENMILFVEVTEFNRSEPTKASEEILQALTSQLMTISNDIVIAPYKREFTKERFQTKLRIQENDGGFPFTIGCSSDAELQKVSATLDDYARRNRFLLAFWGDQNGPSRTFYAGRATGASISSRTTSIELITHCRLGGWTIEISVKQWTDDRSLNLPSIILDLKSLLEKATSKRVVVE